MSLRTRKRAICSEIESVYNTDPVPTGSANAIRVRNLNVMPLEMETESRDTVKPYFGNDDEVVTAVYAKVTFEVEMAGSGTAGTAPAYGPLLRSCGMQEAILAVAHTGTAAAGGAASITLAAGASAVDNAYAGMTIRTTGGTGPGQSAVIKSYVGATKVATLTADWTTPPDATTTYSIDAQVVYRRVTDALESITHYINKDGRLHKMTGSRGTVSIAMPYRKIPTFNFEFWGLYQPVVDDDAPTVVLTAFKKPLAVNSTNTTGLVVMGYTGSVMSDYNINWNNTLTHRNLPGGSEAIVITDSRPTGSITQESTTVAAKDWWALIRAATTGLFSITHGTTAGNKVKIDAPKVQMKKPAENDMDGIEMLATELLFAPDAGNDEITISVM